MHTLAGHQEQNRNRQKVCILVCPVLFAKSMHTRLSRFCGRLRKSAYTSRTPQRQPQQAKSAYTRQPRVLYKKYAYYPDTIRQKVHTLAGHSPEILRAKSVHTRLPQTVSTAAGKKCTPKPAPRLADAATTLRPPEPCRAAKPGLLARQPSFFCLFLPFLFGFVGRGAAVCTLRQQEKPPGSRFLSVLGAYFLLLPPGHAAGRCPHARPGSLYAYFFVFVIHLSCLLFGFLFCICSIHFLFALLLFIYQVHTFSAFFHSSFLVL